MVANLVMLGLNVLPGRVCCLPIFCFCFASGAAFRVVIPTRESTQITVIWADSRCLSCGDYYTGIDVDLSKSGPIPVRFLLSRG